MRTDKFDRKLAYAAGATLFAWFIVLVRGGLDSWFDSGDLMNIHFCWVRPWSGSLRVSDVPQ
jgi:hypothetical protein